MFGPPKDVPGQCNVRLQIGDDYGDNCTTFRCQLPVGHDGRHQEEFVNGVPITVLWDKGNQEDEP